jgi:hypothetical protein
MKLLFKFQLTVEIERRVPEPGTGLCVVHVTDQKNVVSTFSFESHMHTTSHTSFVILTEFLFICVGKVHGNISELQNWR